MPIKHAKARYTRSEVLEILQRNADLYKDEPGFTEYFVQLALYMMDKAEDPDALIPTKTPLPVQFNLGGSVKKEGVPDPPVAFSRARSATDSKPPRTDNAHPATPTPVNRPPRPTAPPPRLTRSGQPQPPTPRPSHTPRPLEQSAPANPMRSMDEVALPNPASLSRDNVPKPFVPKPAAKENPHPPTPQRSFAPPGRERPGIPPPKPRTIGSSPQNPESDQNVGEGSSSSIKRPRTPAVSIERQSLQTPDPIKTNLPPPPPQKDGSQTAKLHGPEGNKAPVVGNTQVYRVVRPYKSQTAMEAPCHSCGTLYPLEATYCPACGTQRRG